MHVTCQPLGVNKKPPPPTPSPPPPTPPLPPLKPLTPPPQVYRIINA